MTSTYLIPVLDDVALRTCKLSGVMELVIKGFGNDALLGFQNDVSVLPPPSLILGKPPVNSYLYYLFIYIFIYLYYLFILFIYIIYIIYIIYLFIYLFI